MSQQNLVPSTLITSANGVGNSVTSEVGLPAGTIRGSLRDSHGVLSFKGIPYAAPPVGPLRWRSPAAVEPWQGIRKTTDFGMRSWAPALRGPVQLATPAGEDCLTLNVWTGAESSSEKRPVMVWFHGGGFQFGSSGDPTTDGTAFAQKGVVLVSVNYRLGIFGFFAHPDLDGEGKPSGNYGLQDQIAALQWINKNIRSFGGDPGNVTFFGQSAGAMSAGLLMTSPLTRGLFHRAIGESGALWDSEKGSIRSHADMLARGTALTERLAEGSLQKLRALSTEELGTATAWGLNLDPITDAFSPSVDGYVLTETPAQALAAGRALDIPVLAGNNTAEGFIYMNRAIPHATREEFEQAAAARFGADRMEEFLELYPDGDEASLKTSAMNYMGDLVIKQQVWEWRNLRRTAGTAAVYGYEYSYTSDYAPIPAHFVEVPFVFATLTPQRLAREPRAPGARDQELAQEMQSYWVNFAHSGDPNGPGLPLWPAYELSKPYVMMFGATTSASQERDGDRHRFLQSFRVNGRFPEKWLMAR